MSDFALSIATTHLWQISVLFALIALFGCSNWARKRSHLMLLLWVLFFVKCLIPPVIESPISPMAILTPTRAMSQRVSDLAGIRISKARTESNLGASLSVDPEIEDGEATTTGFSSSFVVNNVKWIWLAGSLVVLVGFVVNFCFVRRRIYEGVVEDNQSGSAEGATRLLSRLQTQLGMTERRVNLVVSQKSLGPLVFGFWRPTIVLPVEMLRTEIRLKPIIAHELCHVWRRDHLLGFLQIAAQVLFWFHPFVWIASRRVNRLCEVCCDDDAMRIFDLNSKTYAGGLLDVLSMQRVVQPVSIAPGIRPVEVTKQRLKMIVANRKPKTRQSQMIIVCVFLCLIVPAVNSGQSTGDGRAGEAISNVGKMFDPVEVAVRRAELDFLLGEWKVTTREGVAAGKSIFAYEKSGKMIREDWTAPDGSTAQGITFFDPNEACWKMTWVDSAGVIMESSGAWSDNELTLTGWMTSKNGDRRKAQTTISRVDESTLHCQMKIDFEGEFKTVSRSTYRRTSG